MEQKINQQISPTDKVGFETLDSIAEADNFNKWMYETISSETFGEILEIGSGIGNISTFFVDGGAKITVSDLRTEYCNFLDKKFSANQNYKGAIQIDIVDPDFDTKHTELFGSFDSVFALNIIEHVEDDERAIQNCLKLLKPGGKLVILVPAFMFLYNSFDEGLGHYRRYNKKGLVLQFQKAGIKITKSTYFNFIGTLGWWISGNLLKKDSIPGGQMRLYNSLVWLFKVIDIFTRKFVGLSVIVAGKKE